MISEEQIEKMQGNGDIQTVFYLGILGSLTMYLAGNTIPEIESLVWMCFLGIGGLKLNSTILYVLSGTELGMLSLRRNK